jgi:hypothetical protein
MLPPGRSLASTLLLVLAATSLAAAGEFDGALALYFADDPLASPATVVVGDAQDRLTWEADPPAFPGDHPGSLLALYDGLASPGLLGFPLPRALDQDSPFTAGAIFVVHADGFFADPEGFFQISWGLWNSATTGLERTGTSADFAGDAFELLEFDYFPNVSPAFGGPFVSPTVLGEANPGDPSFPFVGSFANVTFAVAAASLPFDEPLLALMEHRPELDSLVVTVFRIRNRGRLVPVTGAVATVPLDGLSSRHYRVDLLGLTLWRDGFAAGAPSTVARVTYHGLILVPELLDRPERILHVPPRLP